MIVVVFCFCFSEGVLEVGFVVMTNMVATCRGM